MTRVFVLCWGLLLASISISSLGSSFGTLRELGFLLATRSDFDFVHALGTLPRYPFQLLLVALALASAHGIGRIVTRLIGTTDSAGLALATGFGVISLVIASLGFSGFLFPRVVLIMTATFISYGIYSLVHSRKEISRMMIPASRENAAPLSIIIVCLALLVIISTTPGTHEDSLSYHWAAPEYYLKAHGILPSPVNIQWHYPLQHEMLYIPALAADNVSAIKAINLSMLVASLVLVHEIALLFVAPQTAAWAPAIMAAIPGFAEHIWLAKNDLGVLLFFLAGLLLLCGKGPINRPNAIAIGLMAGFCASTKYTSLFVLIPLFVLFVLSRPGIRFSLACLSAFLLAMGTWMLRNYLSVANPVYPYLTGLFGGVWWNPELGKALRDAISAITPPESRGGAYWILSWYDLLVKPLGAGILLGILGPIGLAYHPRKMVLIPLVTGVISITLLLSERNSRFLLPLIGPCVIAAVLALDSPWGAKIRGFRHIALVSVLLSVAPLLGRTLASVPISELLWTTGQITSRESQQIFQTTRNSLKYWVNSSISPDSRMLLLGDRWGGYGLIPRTLTAHTVSMPYPWRWSRESSSAERMRIRARQDGIDYIVYNYISAEYRSTVVYRGLGWNPRQIGTYRIFAERYMDPIYAAPKSDYIGGGYFVYKLLKSPKSPASNGHVYFLPSAEGVLSEARRLRGRGMLKGAKENLDKLAPTMRGILSFNSEQGSLAFESGRYQEAVKLLEPCIHSGIKTYTNFEDYGSALINLGKYAQGIHALCNAWIIYPSKSSLHKLGVAYFLRGSYLYRRGDYIHAFRDAEQARFLTDDDTGTHKLLELSLTHLKGNDK